MDDKEKKELMERTIASIGSVYQPKEFVVGVPALAILAKWSGSMEKNINECDNLDLLQTIYDSGFNSIIGPWKPLIRKRIEELMIEKM